MLLLDLAQDLVNLRWRLGWGGTRLFKWLEISVVISLFCRLSRDLTLLSVCPHLAQYHSRKRCLLRHASPLFYAQSCSDTFTQSRILLLLLLLYRTCCRLDYERRNALSFCGTWPFVGRHLRALRDQILVLCDRKWPHSLAHIFKDWMYFVSMEQKVGSWALIFLFIFLL